MACARGTFVCAPAFENQNQIHYSGLDRRPREILLLLAAVSLEEIARLYWSANNKSAPRCGAIPRPTLLIIKRVSRGVSLIHACNPNEIESRSESHDVFVGSFLNNATASRLE